MFKAMYHFSLRTSLNEYPDFSYDLKFTSSQDFLKNCLHFTVDIAGTYPLLMIAVSLGIIIPLLNDCSHFL